MANLFDVEGRCSNQDWLVKDNIGLEVFPIQCPAFPNLKLSGIKEFCSSTNNREGNVYVMCISSFSNLYLSQDQKYNIIIFKIRR